MGDGLASGWRDDEWKIQKERKGKLAESETSRLEVASITTSSVSQALYIYICVYLLSELANYKGSQIIINLGATSYMTSQQQ